MKRTIINIDQDLCNGCGLCVSACHEGAIQMIDGRAKLVKVEHCDGLGSCLPVCPTNAISFKVVENVPYTYKADTFDKETKKKDNMIKDIIIEENKGAKVDNSENNYLIKRKNTECMSCSGNYISELKNEEPSVQWPVQIKLVSPSAPFFKNANLLIAADCTAYAYANFHKYLSTNKIVLIGCPKLDNTDYTHKLAEIIKNNDIKSVRVIRMSVPCCRGLEEEVKQALLTSGKMIPWQVIIVTPQGDILDN